MATTPVSSGIPDRACAPWDPARRHRFVTMDGTGLYVDDSGPSNAGVTLVLVHAWTQDHTEWDPIVAELPAETRVLRYDHRGHGCSAPAGKDTATVATLADDLAELIVDRVPKGRVVLAGHSMGGMTLMALAERHHELVNERVAGVALVATSCQDMDRLELGLRGPAGRIAARADKALGRRLASWGKETMPMPKRVATPAIRWLAFGKGAARGDVRAMTGQVLRAHPRSVGGFRDSMSGHSRQKALNVLRDKPSVVLVGDRDRITPMAHAKVIAEQLPATEFVLFPGAGHELTYERTGEVAERVIRLLQAATA